ncbi:MAG: hypothetical protein K0R39_2510, partial [Symbiobacteriaceae bacterium]|nr:hypothetical protein [Symbiobacteriaceae bacterium]
PGGSARILTPALRNPVRGRAESPTSPRKRGFSPAPTICARETAVLSCKGGRRGRRPGSWAPEGRRGGAGVGPGRGRGGAGAGPGRGQAARGPAPEGPRGLRPDTHAGPSEPRARAGGEPHFAPQTGVFAGSDHQRTRNEGAPMQRRAQTTRQTSTAGGDLEGPRPPPRWKRMRGLYVPQPPGVGRGDRTLVPDVWGRPKAPKRTTLRGNSCPLPGAPPHARRIRSPKRLTP